MELNVSPLDQPWGRTVKYASRTGPQNRRQWLGPFFICVILVIGRHGSSHGVIGAKLLKDNATESVTFMACFYRQPDLARSVKLVNVDVSY